MPRRVPDSAYSSSIQSDFTYILYPKIVRFAELNGGALPWHLDELFLKELHESRDNLHWHDLVTEAEFLNFDFLVSWGLMERGQPLQLVEYYYGDGILRKDLDEVLASVRWQSPWGDKKCYQVMLLHNGQTKVVESLTDNPKDSW